MWGFFMTLFLFQSTPSETLSSYEDSGIVCVSGIAHTITTASLCHVHEDLTFHSLDYDEGSLIIFGDFEARTRSATSSRTRESRFSWDYIDRPEWLCPLRCIGSTDWCLDWGLDTSRSIDRGARILARCYGPTSSPGTCREENHT